MPSDDDDLGGLVWRIVLISTFAPVPDYTEHRPSSTAFFADRDWSAINLAFLAAVRRSETRGSSLLVELDRVTADLSQDDTAALVEMWREPITVSPAQITNGGHRTAAMRRQGVTWTIGMYDREEDGFWLVPCDFPIEDWSKARHVIRKTPLDTTG